MRQLDVAEITRELARLSVEANLHLPTDIQQAMEKALEKETFPPAIDTLNQIFANCKMAEETHLPLCQDTGMAFVFLQAGQEVHFTGGSLEEAIHEGVRLGYGQGCLRKSIVADPLQRTNTGDNTPAFIHYEIVPGDKVTLTLVPKGFGSENMSRLAMLKPSDGAEGVESFILDTVVKAGPNPCPPIVVGVGLGGSFDRAPLLAKLSLLRPLTQPNPNPYYAQMEARLLQKINALGIGPAGYGGATTALGLAIETAPTHIAGLPVAVNISCHATRRASVTI